MIENSHAQLLSKLGTELGLDLEFDENGICDLVFDGRVQIALKSSEDDGTITLTAPLAADFPDPVRFATVLELLAMAAAPSLAGGGNVPVAGIDGESGLVILYEVCTASFLRDRSLAEIFTEFVAVREALAERLSGEPGEGESSVSVPRKSELRV